MYKVKLFNKIAKIGLNRLDSELFTYGEDVEAPEAILVRSAKLTAADLNPELRCIARAGAGVNNIPVEECSRRGIVVFNTPGANANAVKELVIGSLILASRNVIAGSEWVRANAADPDVPALVEKGKSQFLGAEISGKTLGLIGTGAVGALVAQAAVALGMKVIACDPFVSQETKIILGEYVRFVDEGVMKVADYEEIYAQSDYISLHAPATADTLGGINAATLAKMKDGVRIINIARAELVNDDDIILALEASKVACYVTDLPTNKTANVPGIIAIPHLGASTPESEDNCAIMAADEISDYLLRGKIRNSVNFKAN